MVKFVILYMIIIISEQKLELFLYCLKYCLISCQTDCVALTLTLKKLHWPCKYMNTRMTVTKYTGAHCLKVYSGIYPVILGNLVCSPPKMDSFFFTGIFNKHVAVSTNALSTIQDLPGDVCLLLP